MNSVAYLPQSKRLLEQVSEVLRYKHYSLKTEQAYLYWIRFFVRYQTLHAGIHAYAGPQRCALHPDLHRCTEGCCGWYGDSTRFIVRVKLLRI